MVSNFNPYLSNFAVEAKSELAFLGPKGTYSHQAAHERFGETVQYVGKTTIADVFKSVRSGECPIGLVPQENSIHGIVIETYDLLRAPEFGREVFVRGDVAIGIQHCLITRKGVALEDVKRVLSHEQALGQCGQFIRSHLNNPVLVKTPSTVAAVEAILNDEREGCVSAAIASSVCEHLFDGIQVMYKGIQDEKSNFTRFYILTRSVDWPLPLPPASYNPWSYPSSGNKGLLRIREPEACDPSPGFIHTGPRAGNGARGSSLASLLSALDLPICRLDRRPLLGAKTFSHLYIVEVDGDQSYNSAGSSPITSDAAADGEFGRCDGDGIDLQSNKSLLSLEGDEAWTLKLREAVGRVVQAGGCAEVLGCWQ